MENAPDLEAPDERHLRRAIQLARLAIDLGEAPFGSLLVNRRGDILMEAHNTVVSSGDIGAHPEFKIAQWAAREMSRCAAAESTLFTSCEPCAMCGSAIDRSGIGRVVYALSTHQPNLLRGTSGHLKVPTYGPYLIELAADPVRGYYESRAALSPPRSPGS